MDKKVVQSVILNHNENFAQNKAYNNLTPVAGELDIGPNAEVCMYGGSLDRAPIVIRADKNLLRVGGAAFVGDSEKVVPLKLQMLNVYPNQYQTTQDKILNTVQGAPIQQVAGPGLVDEINIEIPEGNYSRDNFCNTLSIIGNNYIANKVDYFVNIGSVSSTNFQIGGQNVYNEFPYYLDYSQVDAGFFLGLRNTKIKFGQTLNGPVNQQLFTVRNHNETNSENVDITADTLGSPATYSIYGANASTQVENWNTFVRSDQALMPMLMENESTSDGNYHGEGTYYSFGLNIDKTGGDGKKQINVGFINTLYQSEWTDSSTPELQTISENDIGEIPNTYLSANFVQVVDSGDITESYIDILMPDTLNETEAPFNYLSNSGTAGAPFSNGNAMVRLSRIQLPYSLPGAGTDEQPTLTGRYMWKFYAEEYKQNAVELEIGSILYTKAERIYYFQLLAENGPDRKVLYDSKSNGVYINANWLDDATLFDCVESARVGAESVSTGFMPITLFNNCTPNDVFFSPQGNFILHETGGDFYSRQRIGNYTFSSTNKDLANTLGIPIGVDADNNEFDIDIDGATITKKLPATNVYNPNAYPVSKNLGGLTSLYSDYNRYNIELNLPIKAFNSTETQVNNIGQKRSIIFNADPFVRGETTNIATSNINKDLEPNTLKFLTLNNSAPLNLNNLRLQIRRAKNNELATEITDSQVEILIRSDPK